jgi:hypothetical protein
MTFIEKYRTYRKIGRELNPKIMNTCLDRDVLMKSFVFPGNLEIYLLRRYKKLSKKVKSDNDSIKRFVSFFELNKTDGMEVRYE